MVILLAGQWSEAERARWLQALGEAVPDAQWCTEPTDDERARIDVAVVANPTPAQLQGLPRLRFVQSLWAGVDRLLASGALPPQVTLARMVDPAMNRAMAETAVWATLSLHRHAFDYLQQQALRQWRVLPQRRADELQVAVLGLGQMGLATAQSLQALGYRVQAWRREGQGQLQGVPFSSGEAGLQRLLAASDIVINLLPLTPATQGLFDAQRFAAMREGIGFVNLARGAQVVEADLLAALDSGRVGRAVLDVFQTEPLPGDHPFWRHPRVTVLPHAAAQTDPRSAAAVVARNLRAFACGEPLTGEVPLPRGY